MKKQQKSILVLAIAAAFIAAMFLPGLISAGHLEPSAPPGETMKTLDQIPPTWSHKLPASERFELVLNSSAVLDKETGLVWLKNANVYSTPKSWRDGKNWCRNISVDGRMGWRLPTVEELQSLVDQTVSGTPKLPSGHPFTNVMSTEQDWYWTSTVVEDSTDSNSVFWSVKFSDGYSNGQSRTSGAAWVWPVRSGNN